MVVSPTDIAASRSAKLLGPLWPKVVGHMKATLAAVLDNNAQCDLVIVDDAGMICHFGDAPNRITISTGQIIRVAAICNIIAQKFSKGSTSVIQKLDPDHFDELQPDKLRGLNIHIVDPHWFDDMQPERHREDIVRRRPPPGIAPAFGDVSDPERLWSWAEQQLSPPRIGAGADIYEVICLFTLAFLVAHEAAHLIFDHINLHKIILKEDPASCENDQKCLEIHADLEAIEAFISGVFRAEAGIDKQADLALALERLALTGVGALVGLAFGDHTMRGLRTYDDPISDTTFLQRKYPHPSVRFALIEGFLFRRLNQIVPHLGDLAMPPFRGAAAAALYALNGWYLSEAKKAGKGDWALPHPFSLVMSQKADYPTRTAEEFQTQHLPAYFARHFPGRLTVPSGKSAERG